jgi:hypothetical protein
VTNVYFGTVCGWAAAGTLGINDATWGYLLFLA